MRKQDYFNRQIQLWGEDTQESLQDKRVAIIGSGGLGCSLGMALGTSGIGFIDIVDFDEVSLSNIHRQIAFRVSDEGSNKAEVLKSLVEAKNPFVEVRAFDMKFDEFASFDYEYDLILDATDNLETRIAIDRYAKGRGVPWIYGSVEAFNGQVCFLDCADFGVFNLSDHKPAGITAPIVMHIASLQANFALRYLAGLSVSRDNLFYLYFTDEGELVTQKFGMPKA